MENKPELRYENIMLNPEIGYTVLKYLVADGTDDAVVKQTKQALAATDKEFASLMGRTPNQSKPQPELPPKLLGV